MPLSRLPTISYTFLSDIVLLVVLSSTTTLEQKEVILTNVDNALASSITPPQTINKPSTDKCMPVVHVIEPVEKEPA
ncbi:hypothetical protein BASA83_005642 [Batrachochytrium salamandrivorans]|nr:hypothetical protein BASA83_005642 [Batrachochytrium salamandrivorans]